MAHGTSPRKIALVGIGKIARDQHVPALQAGLDWELAATVSRSGTVEGVEAHRDFDAFLAARPDIEVTIVLFVVGAAIAGISRWALTASDLAERRQGYVTYALDARSGDMSRDEVAQRLAGLCGEQRVNLR